MSVHFPFDNSYARLPQAFHRRVAPTPVPAPRLVKLNRELALNLGLDPDALASPEGVEILAGKRVPDEADPIATVYAGHQFGQFVPQLGDGRAILLGEVVDRDGVRRDVQLKGAGPTPFSRNGDGRAALGPVLREYLVSEAMAKLGIPTTRALAAVTTGEHVFRETILPGAVLTRVASSHIRVGTFQFFAGRGDVEGLGRLVDHVVARHYPELAEAPNKGLALLGAVVDRQAALIARWLLVGFIHGVMNTDNMSIAGETIDYGPCAFMDSYDPATVFSSIDHGGRYAYGNQPWVGQWNLARLAESLLPVIDPENVQRAIEPATELVVGFKDRYEAAFLDGMRRKLGLATAQEGDFALARNLLDVMAAGKADFTATFRRLADAAASAESDAALRGLFGDGAGIDAWLVAWRARCAAEGGEPQSRRAAMRQASPAFIPRNHRVEAVIEAAVQRQDFAPFEELLAVLMRPFDDQPDFALYADPPAERNDLYQTFCGT